MAATASATDKRRTLFGWCMYDWANSAYATTVLAGVLPLYFADVIVFDPASIADRSTYEKGRQTAVGMEHVLVNGEVVLQAGKRTAALPGKGFRRD